MMARTVTATRTASGKAPRVPAGRRWVRGAKRAGALGVATLLLSSCGWRGIANVPLPGGPGTQAGHSTIYIQMPDTLGLNANSRVRVSDVFIGRVRKIELKTINNQWVPTLTVDLEPGVHLPRNVLAKIGQTSLLGSQHVELDAPADPSSEPLRDGDTIPLADSSAYPTVERTLAGIAAILTGGGISNIEKIQTETLNILQGRGDQIREFLQRLDTFTKGLNAQRADITRAINSSNTLLNIVAQHNTTLDQVLTDLPPVAQHFADKEELFSNAVLALGRLSKASDDTLRGSSANLAMNLATLQCTLKQISDSAPNLVPALDLLLTLPFPIDNLPKIIRGDYVNLSLDLDLTLSAVDNSVFSGTGISGMLRALEQSWGRDPATMIPDVRFTPNPHNAPGGPRVERAVC